MQGRYGADLCRRHCDHNISAVVADFIPPVHLNDIGDASAGEPRLQP